MIVTLWGRDPVLRGTAGGCTRVAVSLTGSAFVGCS